MTFGILGLAFIAGEPTSVTAEQSYPWCAQGDNTLHCYYTTREQCEAAVNYHGFCVGNSNVPTQNSEAPQRPLRRRRQIRFPSVALPQFELEAANAELPMLPTTT
jgi:hypothetical protein